MTWTLLSFVFLVAGLLGLLGWSLRAPGTRARVQGRPTSAIDSPLRHAFHFPQVRQSLSADDLAFLATRGSHKLARRARIERRRVTAGYVRGLRQDFRNLLHLARVLAALSPEVVLQQESERFWLAVRFECLSQLTHAALLTGISPLPQIQRMTQIVGTLGAHLETAIVGLGEQAALAAEFASTMHRGGRLNLS